MMKKHFLYLKTLLKHKWYVFLECCKYGLYWQGIVHDWHKFLPSEWFAYVEKFHGVGPDELSREANFVKAMNHHMNIAKHHWNHWIFVGYNGDLVAVPMPERYWLEMICDWNAASRVYSGKPDCLEWYAGVQDKIILHDVTRIMVESELGI